MTYCYKKKICDLIENYGEGFFHKPSSHHVREYPLRLLPRTTGRSDFCYEFLGNGKLFVEDDDPARALNNLIKYWRWVIENNHNGPIILIHIIGAKNGIALENCKFLAQRMERDLKNNPFNYHQITHGDWGSPDTWLPEVKLVLDGIVKVPDLSFQPTKYDEYAELA